MDKRDDSYKPVNKYTTKKGTTILDTSAEESVDKLLMHKVGLKPERKQVS